jgi:hypothetical protein
LRDRTPAFPGIHDALLQLVQRALPIVLANGPRVIEDERWVRHEHTMYRQVGAFRHWNIRSPQPWSQIELFPEFGALRQAIGNEPAVERQLGTLVGTPLSAMQITLESVVSTVIAKVLNTGAETFDAAAFETAYSEIERGLASDTVTYWTVAPLVGFACSADGVRLSPSVAIRKLTDAEVVRSIEVGLLQSVFGQGHPIDPPDFAIEVSQTLPKRVGEQSESAEQVQRWFEEPQTAIAHLVSVLRLFKTGRVAGGGTIAATDQWFAPMASVYQRGDVRPPYNTTYELSATEVTDFVNFYTACDSDAVRRSKGLEMAIRRLDYSAERQRVDDKIVDLMIAAEALFLGQDRASERGELRYRLSLRAALFTPSNDWSPRQLFNLYRTAYDARSTVAHGGSQERRELPDGTSVSLAVFSEEVAKQLRMAVKRAIEHCATSRHQFNVDWEGLILPSSSN